MKPHRVLWQVLPNGGWFRWKLIRDGKYKQLFLTQAGAIKEAKRLQDMEWRNYGYVSELQIHDRDGKIREKDTFPRSSDPAESKG